MSDNSDKIRDYSFDRLSPERRREIQSAGGKASQVVRRRRKAVKSILSDILQRRVPESVREALINHQMISEDDNATYDDYINAQLIRSALKGNVKAYRLIQEMTGVDPNLKLRQEELRLRREELQLKRAALVGDDDRDVSLGEHILSISYDDIMSGEDDDDAVPADT